MQENHEQQAEVIKAIEILSNLNKKLQTASMAVSGDAARAQEHLCKLPEKVKRVYERTKSRVQHNMLQPAWVHE